jgi:hypothetical protein
MVVVASIAALALSSVSFSHGWGLSVDEKAKIVTVKPSDFKSEMSRLRRQGYDIAGVDLDKGEIDVVTGEVGLSALSKTKGLSIVRSKAVLSSQNIDDGYTTYAELTQALQTFAANFPEILKVESFGKTLEGRDMWVVKISDNVDQSESEEPSVFFNAMHHAREVMTTEVALDLIGVLTSGVASGNERIKKWVDQNEIWIVPMVNPDGSNKVWTSDSMWRKNARGNYGVDINRNYPYKWGACSGSSGTQSAQDYRGPSAASEPETQAMMNLVSRINPVMSISYHSYSELVLYPMSCDGQHAEDREIVELVGKQLASRLPKDTGGGTYKPGTSWEILYAVDGGDLDWLYAEQDVLPYVVEINGTAQGFQPSFSKWRQKTVEKMRAGWGYFLDRVGGSGLRGRVFAANGSAMTTGQVTIESLGSNTDPSTALKTYKIKSNGTFQVLLKPGMYKVRLQGDNRSAEADVIVGSELNSMDFIL